jgi:DNA-binding protein H-NS
MTNLLDIQAQIAILQAEAAKIIDEQRATVISEIKEKVASYQLVPADIFDDKGVKVKGVKREASSKPAAIKYRSPNGETWSGRGLKPRWLSAEIEAGKSLNDFLIA